jgi:hypothetical protein
MNGMVGEYGGMREKAQCPKVSSLRNTKYAIRSSDGPWSWHGMVQHNATDLRNNMLAIK